MCYVVQCINRMKCNIYNVISFQFPLISCRAVCFELLTGCQGLSECENTKIPDKYRVPARDPGQSVAWWSHMSSPGSLLAVASLRNIDHKTFARASACHAHCLFVAKNKLFCLFSLYSRNKMKRNAKNPISSNSS